MGADHFLAALDSAEMGVGTHGENMAATGAAIALEMQAGGKTLKVSGGEAVAMEFTNLAVRTDFGPLPRIIFALLKNILEKDANKTYHGAHVLGGQCPRM